MAPVSPFVGRADELRRLNPMVAGNNALLVVGEAGVGKSRLAAELAAGKVGNRCLSVTVACLPLAGRLPLLPIVDMARALLVGGGVPGDDVLEHCPWFVREDLARLIPELSAEPLQRSDAWQQQRLFASLVYLLEAAQARLDLTVVVEDVHWSDPATRDFLTYLVAHMADGAASLIMTARTEQAAQDPKVRRWLREISLFRSVMRVELLPLSPVDVGALAHAILGSPLAAPAAAELHRRTGGNPFFVEQLLAAEAEARPGELPDQLAVLLRERARSVNPLARQVLSVLGLAGRPLLEAELATISSKALHVIREALRDLLERQLAARAADGFAPRHTLLGEAVATELLPSEAQDLHAAIAGVLIDRRDPRVAAEAAAHCAQAGRPAAELKARIEAAEYAESLFAFREAAQHWERALTLAETEDVEDVSRLALRGMEAWASAGESMRGLPLGERGLLLAACGHGSRTLHAAVKLRLSVLSHPGNVNKEIEALSATIQEFEDLTDSSDQVAALTQLYFDHRSLGQNQVGVQSLFRAVEIGARLPTSGYYVSALANLAYEHGRVGDVVSASRYLDMANSAAQEGADPYTFSATRVRLMQNHLEDVIAGGREQLKLLTSQGLGGTSEAAIVTRSIVDALLELGQVDAAGQLVDVFADQEPLTSDGMHVEVARSRIDLARGELPSARTRLERVFALDLQLPLEVASDLSRIGAEIALWAGEPATAFAALRSLIPTLIGSDEPRLAVEQLAMAMRACADLTAIAAASQDRALSRKAAELRHELLAARLQVGSEPFDKHPFFATAAAHGTDWNAECARCQQGDTWEHWDDAASHWEELQRQHRAAYARWRQAEALFKAGRRPEAVAALTAARRLADQHRPLLASIINLARMARVDFTPPGPVARQARVKQPGMYSLTARELDVLNLVVEGLTNAQIGTRLYMSPKTVSVHITAILRKLHATNRVHAAAIAQRAGLTAHEEAGLGE